MATDYASSPSTRAGQYVFGVGCGVITMLFRLWGPTPEGVNFAIIIMNFTVPMIDQLTRPRVYGEKRRLSGVKAAAINERIRISGISSMPHIILLNVLIIAYIASIILFVLGIIQ
jgi:hypothetical protein